MPLIKSFQELEVWQKAHALALDVYQRSANFTERERYDITSQIRRSAVSIPANIAEGFGRRSTGELLHFLAVANGSLEETGYFLLLARDLRFLATDHFEVLNQQCNSVGQMIGALSRSLRSRNVKDVHGPQATSHGPRIEKVRSRVGNA